MDGEQGHKAHHKASRGRKASRKKQLNKKKKGVNVINNETNNYKAFTVANVGRRQRETQRKVDRAHRKHVAPAHKSEAEAIHPPPVNVVVHGPKGSGKTTLIRSLVKHWTKQSLVLNKDFEGFGPINVVAARNRRLTLFECPSNDICSMIDLSKISDLVLLLIDAKQGISLETFEMLNCLQAHGMAKVISVITHLDELKNLTVVKKTKKRIKQRIWTETYDGAKVFYMSQIRNHRYLKNEINNLARFVALAKFRPLSWKNSHSYLLADRIEDITPEDDKERDAKCDRNIVLFGFLHGMSLRHGTEVHLCGVGDFNMDQINIVPDPLPLGKKNENSDLRIRLKEKETVIYAPMANIGSVVYDKDAVYINLPKAHFSKSEDIIEDEGTDERQIEETEGVRLVKELQNARTKKTGLGLKLFRSDSTSDNEENDYDSDSSQSVDSQSSSSEDSSDDGLKSKVLNAAHGNLSERINNRVDLMDLIYNVDNIKNNTRVVEIEDEDDENFFQPLSESTKPVNGTQAVVSNVLDTLKPFYKTEDMVDWTDPIICAIFKNRFVTGNWKSFGSEDESEDSHNDFVDLEEQEKSREALAKDKEDKKLEFDANYDESKLKGEESTNKDEEEVDLDDSFMKTKIERSDAQKNLNRTEFSELDPASRAEHEGFRPGSYIRVVLKGVRYEFIKFLNPRRPVLLGSLESTSTSTESTFTMGRIKKHRWFEKEVLKTNDPLIFSFGWRRFQSVPVYFIEDRNQRQRMLKYTPKHMHCNCLFFSKPTPINSPFLCIQDIRENQKTFRIAALGTSLQITPTSNIRKKLKLIGEPYKIQKNTSFIKKMFTSSLEVAKFEGAKIQTVSGIRGVIKKAVTTPRDTGCFRASFEDKLLMSDIVFCKTWIRIEPYKFYNPIYNMLNSYKFTQTSEISKDLMKTVGQLRYERQVAVPVNQDSLYKEIKRKPRVFKQLVLPKSLEKNLPFKDRPKQRITKKKAKDFVIMTQREKKVSDLLNKLNTLRKVKTKKNEEKKIEKRKLKEARERKLMQKFESVKKAELKRKYRQEGLRQKHKQAKF